MSLEKVLIGKHSLEDLTTLQCLHEDEIKLNLSQLKAELVTMHAYAMDIILLKRLITLQMLRSS